MKTAAAIFAAVLLTGCSTPVSRTCRVYFGTAAPQESGGIYMTEIDLQTGMLRPAVRISSAVSAGFIAIPPGGHHLYAANESKGSICAFRISEPDGSLTAIGTQSSGGTGPCYLSIDPSGKNLLAANYTGASCSVLPILSDGSPAPTSSIQKHTGSSVHPARQTKAFTHSVICDPSGKFALAADLGTDKIMFYRFNADSGTLTPNDPSFIKTEPGGGPRHITFHPSGKFVYAGMELSSKVAEFKYTADKGILTDIGSASTLPGGFSGKNTASEILTSPDGRFLYVGNRGHNSLAVFAIDPANGQLTPLGHESTRGESPRSFDIDPTGRFLIAANQKSGSAVVFRINRRTGLLEFTGSSIELPAPVCVRFLQPPIRN